MDFYLSAPPLAETVTAGEAFRVGDIVTIAGFGAMEWRVSMAWPSLRFESLALDPIHEEALMYDSVWEEC